MKGSSRCGESTSGSGGSSRSNDRERGLTEIGEIRRVHAIFEIYDTNIKVDGGKAIILVPMMALFSAATSLSKERRRRHWPLAERV